MHFDLEQSGGLCDIGQKLRDLPSRSAPPIYWDEFKRRQALKRARLRSAQRRQITQVASVALVMLGAIAVWNRLPSPQTMVAARATAPVAALESAPQPLAWDEAAARSAAAERWLAALPEEPVIVRVGTRAAVTNLEDRIAWVDDTLTSMRAEGGGGARASALQYERNRLINSLAQVRYAEVLGANLP
jgi:hypothetical protein